MINLNIKSLIDKLSIPLKTSLEAAAAMAMSRSNASVELEHWLLKVTENLDSDLNAALGTYKVDSGRVNKDLLTAIEKFKTGHNRAPALAVELIDAIKLAWLIASVEHGLNSVYSAHILAAAMLDDQARRELCDAVPALKEIAPESLRESIRGIVGKTPESAHYAATNNTASIGLQPSSAPTATPALDKYTVNLTERAASNKIDPVLGRDAEIRQCIDILTRRRQNNPILTGEAGVGKTAVVEGLALHIASNDVPDLLKGVVLRTLDLGLLQAGASVKGEFENRLRQVIDEVKAASVPIILFIDEAHTLIGAGGKEGQGDAANLLKPALARGELRTIAATTWAEYKKYFERDPALTRRFQVVKVEEPDEANAIEMMRGLAPTLQKHHKVRISDEAIKASVKLSHRYIPSRQLPDKSVSLLDTACARVALSMSSTPAAIEDAKRVLIQLDKNIERIELENAASGTQTTQIEVLQLEKTQADARLHALQAQWQSEQSLVKEILELRDQLEMGYQQRKQQLEEAPSEDAIKALQAQLKEKEAQLRAIQSDQPLMTPIVDSNAVAEVVANWTGIPVNKMLGSEIHAVMNLAGTLKKRVIGQDHAIEAIAQAIRASRAGLNDPRKPLGVFLMVGTSGVGKTETALAVADMLFGGEHSITVINMSEFKEEHKVSMLLGSPPGYVGYGEGGVLTEAARRKPYSVILLDEMEKAHHGVQDIFYNLFDKGTIKDGEGRDIDFKNTLIIMTTNAGEDAIRAIMSKQETRPDPEVLTDSIRPELLRHFKPAFLGRCTLVTYFPLEDEQLLKICDINLNRIAKRLRAHYDAGFSYDEDVSLHIVARCQEAETGARNLENIISRSLLPELASQCLTRLGQGESVSHVHITVDEDGNFGYQIQ